MANPKSKTIGLNDLRANPGARPKLIRVGRGPGSGRGKQCGRGAKGQGSRSGGGLPYYGFEGGQNPLYKRIPKLGGFNHDSYVQYSAVNLWSLNKLPKQDVINLDVLKQNGLVKRTARYLKILAEGELTQAVTIQAHKVSEAAQKKISKAGGKVELIPVTKTASAKPEKKE